MRNRHGEVVLLAVTWVDLPDAASAIEFRRLVDRAGTGNVTALSRERGPFRGVRITGRHYASRRDAATVVIAQAEPVNRAGRTATSMSSCAAR